MKNISVKLPDDMASDMDSMIRKGYFRSKQQLLSLALHDFFRHHKPDLERKYQLNDIKWAKSVARQVREKKK